jgi:hypothetical protein
MSKDVFGKGFMASILHVTSETAVSSIFGQVEIRCRGTSRSAGVVRAPNGANLVISLCAGLVMRTHTLFKRLATAVQTTMAISEDNHIRTSRATQPTPNSNETEIGRSAKLNYQTGIDCLTDDSR